MEVAVVRTNKDGFNIIKNYFYIEDSIEIKDLLYSLGLLSEDGILLLMGVTDNRLIESLEEFMLSDIQFPDIGKNITFSFFKKIKEKNIAVRYNNESKNVLYEVIKDVVPNIEICSYLYFLTDKQEMILEYKVDDAIFISRDIIKSDESIRRFCKEIGVNRYCLEEF